MQCILYTVQQTVSNDQHTGYNKQCYAVYNEQLTVQYKIQNRAYSVAFSLENTVHNIKDTISVFMIQCQCP